MSDQPDAVRLDDDGEAAFDITERATGRQWTAAELTTVFIRDWSCDADEPNARFAFRCRACGSVRCRVEDNVQMGSSWTGPYGSADLVCLDCKASRELYSP
jgi:hypothetical protein